MPKLILTVAMALLLAFARTVHAADEPQQGAPAQARRLTHPLTLDGRLDEADWRAAPALSQLVETYPADRGPPPEHTEVRFLYDDQYLYVGVRADLKDPSRLRAPFVRRDKVGATLDYVQLYLDPLGARRSAYLFRFSARGTKTDGIQDEAAQADILDPDFDWDVATHIDDRGWSAELRIPLSTLRIAKVGPQRWWVIVTRGVPRRDNLQMATAHAPHDASCWLCYASPLTFADLTPRTESLIVVPSVTVIGRHDSGADGHGDHLQLHPSLDLKWLPYAGGAVDLTVNPDFSQVEADSPQLTANARFALDLPEKRPFFREGLDLVSTPIAALYTRAVAEPELGLRFTHRSDTLNATAFVAQDTGRPGIIEPGLLSSTTVYPDFESEVAFGHAKLAEGPADAGVLGAFKRNDDGSYNAVVGLDGGWGDATDRFSGQVLASRTRDPNRPDLLPAWTGESVFGLAASAEWDHTAANVWTVKYTRFDNGFRSWLGYVPRVGYQEGSVDFRRPLYPHAWGLNDVTPYVDFDALVPLDHAGHEGGAAFGFTASGKHNLNLDVSYHPGAQVLDEQGVMHATSFVKGSVFANPFPRVPRVELDATTGTAVDFATGRVVPATTLTALMILRPLDRLELQASLSGDQLGDAPGLPYRLREIATELIATWYFGPAFYVAADYQAYRSDRPFAPVDRDRTSLLSVQFSCEASRDLALFWGVRSGAEQPFDPTDRGRSTEVFFKVSRAFRLGARRPFLP
jgi:hypothetical protein